MQSRYHCTLSEDLASWFDEELWRVEDQADGDRYGVPVSPEELLSPTPAAIWPALMPCDFLPLLGNRMGDWLCVRIDRQSRAREIVQWYHGGGDWIPWGASIAEALLFDHVRPRLPGSQRDHAVAAVVESPRRQKPSGQRIDWAAAQLGSTLPRDWELLRGDELAEAMLEQRLSPVAVLCQLTIDALDNPLLSADDLHELRPHDRDAVLRCLLDNRLLAPQTLKQLTERASQAAGERVTPETFLRQQRWAAAAHYARLATELAPPLAWAWDLLGYCHERDGAIEEARDCYRCGLECSIFTDQTVRVRTHGFNGDGQKFSAARLQVLGFEPRDAAEREYFECLCLPQPDVRRDRIRELFAQRASAAHGGEAHELWQRAGWDLGAEPMAAFAELLEGVAAAAAAAGRGGQSELAHTHRACFRQRYGL